MSLNTDGLLKIIIAFFLPPVTAYLVKGCGWEFWLNLLLTFLFFLPGFIHALYLVFTDPNSQDDPNAINGNYRPGTYSGYQDQNQSNQGYQNYQNHQGNEGNYQNNKNYDSYVNENAYQKN